MDELAKEVSDPCKVLSILIEDWNRDDNPKRGGDFDTDILALAVFVRSSITLADIPMMQPMFVAALDAVTKAMDNLEVEGN